MFEGFEEIYPEKRGRGEYGVNVLEDGIVTINQRLRDKIGDSKIRFFVKADGSQIVISPVTEEGFKVNKAGRFRCPEVYDKMKRKKMIFPVHFTLKAEKDYFLGDLNSDYRKRLKEK